MNSATRLLLGAALAVGLVSAGCTDVEEGSPTTTTLDITTTTMEPAPTGDEDEDVLGTDTTAPPGPGAGGAMFGCEQLAESDEGIYPVRDAGEVELRRDSDRLELIEVRASEGWTHEVDAEKSDGVGMEFRSNGRKIDFEAEIDDDELDITVCEDD
jgi:hypothetical protein